MTEALLITGVALFATGGVYYAEYWPAHRVAVVEWIKAHDRALVWSLILVVIAAIWTTVIVVLVHVL